MLDYNYHPDYYGYYQIGNRKTYSKFEFMDWLKMYPADWHYHYNDEFFSSYDWTVEPSEDLNTLYKKRALELREKYDYLILYFSGGTDSSNMLYAFLDNNIKVDEIFTFMSSKDNISGSSKELATLAWPKIKAIQEKHPDIKITQWDYSEHITDWYDKATRIVNGENPIYSVACGLVSINRLIVDFAHEYIPHWQKMHESGTKVGMVRGVDKPLLRYKNNQWRFNFHDGIILGNITPGRVMSTPTAIPLELFYWAPTHACSEIIRKQCHTIKNTLNIKTEHDLLGVVGAKNTQSDYGWEFNNNASALSKIVYPRLFENPSQNLIANEQFIVPDVYFSPSVSNYIFGNRDQWFTQTNNDLAKQFHQMWESANDPSHSAWHEWFHDKKDIRSGVTNCITRDYIF